MFGRVWADNRDQLHSTEQIGLHKTLILEKRVLAPVITS